MIVDVRSDLKDVERMLQGLKKDQIPFATAYALTQTAKAAQANIEYDIKRVFKAPTPYTKKAVRTVTASKTRLSATVKLKDESFKGNPAVRYLIYQITGGPRGHKGFEKLLHRAGVMPSGWFAVPTRNAPLDAYGNVPGSVITRILSQLQASRDELTRETPTSRARNLRKKARVSRYFVALPGRARTAHLAPGIWERVSFGFGSSVRPVFIFTASAPTYSKRLPFYETIDRTIEQELARQFERGFRVAQATQGKSGAAYYVAETEALMAG
jgi:hypothetical protein